MGRKNRAKPERRSCDRPAAAALRDWATMSQDEARVVRDAPDIAAKYGTTLTALHEDAVAIIWEREPERKLLLDVALDSGGLSS
jgi:hypothetical protein